MPVQETKQASPAESENAVRDVARDAARDVARDVAKTELKMQRAFTGPRKFETGP